MRSQVLTQPMVQKELVGVADRLASPKLSGPQRLTLLRRQAQLGDLRDALLDRRRRESL